MLNDHLFRMEQKGIRRQLEWIKSKVPSNSKILWSFTTLKWDFTLKQHSSDKSQSLQTSVSMSKKMEIIISRNILWIEWDNGCEQAVHTVGEKQMVTMTKWLCPKDDSKPILTRISEPYYTYTHNPNSCRTRSDPSVLFPLYLCWKPLFQYPLYSNAND